MTDLLNQIPAKVVINGNTGNPHDDHLFTVDGEDFPWYISERGPIVTRLADDLYVIDVEILLLDKETKDYLPFAYVLPGAGVTCWPILGGREFPWLLTSDDARLDFGHKMLPTLKLAFFARSVHGDIPVEDKRPAKKSDQEDIYCAGGDLIHAGKARCGWCNQLVVSECEHIEQEHPEHVTVRDDGQKSYRVS